VLVSPQDPLRSNLPSGVGNGHLSLKVLHVLIRFALHCNFLFVLVFLLLGFMFFLLDSSHHVTLFCSITLSSLSLSLSLIVLTKSTRKKKRGHKY
jgi:hypothetical protein